MPCLLLRFNRFILIPIVSEWLSLHSFVLLDGAIVNHEDSLKLLELVCTHSNHFKKHLDTMIESGISIQKLNWLNGRNLLQYLEHAVVYNSNLHGLNFQLLPVMTNIRSIVVAQCTEENVKNCSSFLACCPNLETCDLSHSRCWTIDEILKSLANHSPSLTKINCTDVINLEDYSMIRLLRCCPALTDINVDGCCQLTRNLTVAMTNYGVLKFSAARCEGLNSNDFGEMLQYNKVPLMEFTCHGLIASDIQALMIHVCTSALLKLDFSCGRLPPMFFPEGVALCTNLEYLTLNHCDFSDCQFSAALSLPHLKTVHNDSMFGEFLLLLIPDLKSVSDLTLQVVEELPYKLSMCCPNLEKLNLHFNQAPFQLWSSLKELPRLTALTISGYSIYEAEFVQYIPFMKDIRSLDISGCNNLRRKTLDWISTHCRELVDFRYGEVYPNGVLTIVIYNKNLVRLHAYCNCILIPDMIEFGQQLKYFGVLNSSLEDCAVESLTYFIKSMKNLVEVTVYPLYRDGIDEKEVREVHPNLVIIETQEPL